TTRPGCGAERRSNNRAARLWRTQCGSSPVIGERLLKYRSSARAHARPGEAVTRDGGRLSCDPVEPAGAGAANILTLRASVGSTEAGFPRRLSHAGCSDRASRAVVFLTRACIEAWSHLSTSGLLLDRRGGGGAPRSQERGVLIADSRDHFL